MASATEPAVATLADLAETSGKAELIGGRIVLLMPTGYGPGVIGGRIFRSPDDHARLTGTGVALPDNVGFAVPELPSGRQSFSPNASDYLGPPRNDDMDFIEGPPTFAVEVRSESDVGPAAEEELAAKRADYFAAGTRVVWDVDVIAGEIRLYRPDSPDVPVVFGPGESAHAEPVLSGWRVDVNGLFA